MARRRYWNITVTDGLTEVYSTIVARGDVGQDSLREMMRRLAIHFAHLTADEIVSASRTKQKLIWTSEQDQSVALADITVMARHAEREKAAG